MKKLIVLLFLFQIWNSSYSQEREATIHFIDNTSLKGIAEIKRNKIFFRFTKVDEISKWGHDFAKGVTFSGYGFTEKYEYVKPNKYSEPIIMEVLEEGNVNLYRKNKIDNVYSNSIFLIDNSNTLEHHPILLSSKLDSTYYVKRQNEDFSTDISFSFKSRAKKYFSDCQDILDGIEDKSYDKDTIYDMVLYYNKYCNTKK